jgi:predicted MFS family arabinose efflux permease
MKRSLQSPRPPTPALFTTSGVALIAATYGLARLGYGLFLPAFSSSFALSPTVSGLLSSGASVLYCVAAAIGFLLAPIRPRTVTLLAGTSAAIGSLGIAGANTTAVFAVAVLLAGMGAGFASPALVELVRRNSTSETRDRRQSVINSGTGFGVVVAGLLSLVLGSDWRIAWVLVAVIALVSTAGVLWLDRGERAQAGAPRTGPSGPNHLTRSSFRDLGRPLVGSSVLGAGSAAVWVYGRATLEQSGGMTTELSAGAWIALGLGGAGATLAARWLATRPIATTWSVSALGTAAATVLIATAAGTPLLAYAAAGLFGLAYTAATSVLILWASLGPGNSAAGTSLLFIALVLGQAAGAALSGVAMEAVGPGPTFVAAALACAASTLVLCRSRHRTGRGHRGQNVSKRDGTSGSWQGSER